MWETTKAGLHLHQIKGKKLKTELEIISNSNSDITIKPQHSTCNSAGESLPTDEDKVITTEQAYIKEDSGRKLFISPGMVFIRNKPQH